MNAPAPLRNLRSIGCFVVLLGAFCLGGLFQRVVIWPVVWISSTRRIPLISAFMHVMAKIVLFLIRAGGGDFERSGTVPTDRPVLILMNHQSLVDIPVATALAVPFSPAFVTRRRYARGIPMVSPMLKLRGCPIVDPEIDPRGAILTLKKASREEEHALLIFPEGHRSRDGQIGPFNSAGARVILRERRMPVYVVVTDGFWVGRRLQDFVLNLHRIRGWTEVLGPFDPPTADAELEAFVDSMRDVMMSRLKDLRRNPHARL
jgi:1-acyl-sn-glycerol-3-phosphate acyltransferase